MATLDMLDIGSRFAVDRTHELRRMDNRTVTCGACGLSVLDVMIRVPCATAVVIAARDLSSYVELVSHEYYPDEAQRRVVRALMEASERQCPIAIR